MRMTLGLTVLLAAATALAAEEKNAPLAKVRVAGELSGIQDVTFNGKSSSSGDFTTPRGLEIQVKSTSSFSKVYYASVRAKLDLINAQTEDLLKLLDDKKLGAKERKQAIERLEKEYEERGKAVCVVEGSLTTAGKALRLSGTSRLIDTKKLDRDLPVGGAMVEGEAEAGTFVVGKEKATLAVKNGAAPIYVTGKAVGLAKRKGKLRVYGHLKQGDKGALVLEATKIEAIK